MKASPELVMAIRDLAREDLRARWICNIQAVLLSLTNQITAKEAIISGINKQVAQANYNISKLDSANPSYETLLASENNTIKYSNENIAYNEEAIKSLNEEIKGTQAEITKVVAGESKVDAENLNVKAKELIEKFYASKVTEIEA
jgi:uncharacterized coiled-coil protein SlyX